MLKPKIKTLRSTQVEHAVKNVCSVLKIEPPSNDHLVFTVVPYLTRLDFDAIERDEHPLWRASLKLKYVFGGSMYGMAELMGRLKAALSEYVSKNPTSQTDKFWNDYIRPRKYTLEGIGGIPIASDRDLSSPLLNKVEPQDLVDIQRLIHTIRMNGGPPKLINVTANASGGVDVKITHLVNPVTDQLMESTYLGCDDPKQEWIDNFTSVLKDSIPHWDFIAEADTYSSISVHGKLDNPAVGVLLSNALYYVYKGE